MPAHSKIILAALAAMPLAACTSAYTGPVEVTRFVAADAAPLGQGPITLYFPDEIGNSSARAAFADSVADELGRLGYTVVMQEGAGIQVASVRTSRGNIESADRRRGPVSVGVGGSRGTYGGGLGVGLGINLGGDRGPVFVTDLSVRIVDDTQRTLWEGRAELPTSAKSPYADIDRSADALAAALFKDFPGGNGETVQVSVDELERIP